MIDEEKLAEWEEHVRILRGFYPTASDDVALALIAEVRRLQARVMQLTAFCEIWHPVPEEGCDG